MVGLASSWGRGGSRVYSNEQYLFELAVAVWYEIRPLKMKDLLA